MSGVLFSYAKYFSTHYRHRRRLMLLLGGLFLSTFVTFYSHTYNNNTQRCSVLLLWHELFACCFLCKCKHLMGTAFREREVISPYHILNKTLCWLISSHRTVEVLNEYQNRQYTEKGWKKENIKQDKKEIVELKRSVLWGKWLPYGISNTRLPLKAEIFINCCIDYFTASKDSPLSAAAWNAIRELKWANPTFLSLSLVAPQWTDKKDHAHNFNLAV
jgi:hypothetical protein